MTDTKLYKVIVMMENGTMATCAGIEHEGAVWLVPKWLPFPDEGYTKPERMIRLDQFRHQRLDPPATGPGPMKGADYIVNDQLPTWLLDGSSPPNSAQQRYVFLDRPDLRFRTGGTLN